MKDVAADRKGVLTRSQEAFERYLNLLDAYRMLSAGNTRLYERYSEDKNGFSLMESHDAAMRRESKIRRFREEKDLKTKLEVCKISCLSSASVTYDISTSPKIQMHQRRMTPP